MMSYAAAKDIVPILLRLRRIHEDSGTIRANRKGKGKGMSYSHMVRGWGKFQRRTNTDLLQY
jgi:hypothetical protein